MSLPSCAVVAHVYKQDGTPDPAATVTARLSGFEVYEGHVVPEEVTADTDEFGVATLNLFPNALGATETVYRVRIEGGSGSVLTTTAVVPNIPTANLEDISALPAYPGKSEGELAIQAALDAGDTALAAATAASDSATIASTAATAASTSATAAADSAFEAAASATAAAGSATAAAGSASAASTAATNSQTYRNSALTYRDQAEAHKNAAATSATNAATSATNAANSATAAAGSATTAQSHATAAAASADAAAASASDASGYLATVAASATAAANSATAAAGSATTAASSATAAGSSATNASNSASAASTSASNASTSANSASTSATNAASSASAAATSASQASTSATNAASSASASATSATNAGNSATAAAASASSASTHATSAANSATAAAASETTTNTNVANALAIYGTAAGLNEAQQIMLGYANTATAAVSQAQAHATAAASVAQQDLSGVVAAALHRAPGAVVAMTIYDTSKDSDGGAWIERMAHTSWQNEALNGVWLGAHASEAAARAVPDAATGDFFQLTTDGKFYKLNEGAGTTEVFRGNTAKFPRVAAIVAEAARVVVYDLMATGRPMWMVFTGTGQPENAATMVNSNIQHLACKEGQLWIGHSNSFGLRVVDFSRDRAEFIHQTASLCGRWRGGIAQRQQALGYALGAGSSYSGVLSSVSAINAVAVTTMPDAPVDSATGLQVPTVVVTTSAGANIIRHDGSVVAVSDSWANRAIALHPDVAFFSSSNTPGWVYQVRKPGSNNAISGAAPLHFLNSAASPAHMSLAGRSELAALAIGATVFNRARVNESTSTAGLSSSIAATHNAGWLPGDIRRAWGGSVYAGTIDATEYVVNGTFDTDIAGWTTNHGSGGVSVTHNGGAMRIETTTVADGVVEQQLSGLTPGEAYVLTFTPSNASGTYGLQIRVGTAAQGADLGFGQQTGTPVTMATPFIATVSNPWLTFISFDICAFDLDNISVRRVVADRTYKNKPATVYGTLALTPVAAAAQLCAISGFSATNYAQEAYSADLDFGTAGLAVLAWVSVPQNPQLAQNLAPVSNLFASGANGWSQDGLTVAEGDLASGGRTYAKLQQPVATTGGNRIYRFMPVTASGMQANTSVYVRRVAGSTDRLSIYAAGAVGSDGWVGDAIYDPVTQTMSGAHAAKVTVTVLDADTVRLSTVNSYGTSVPYWQLQVLRASDSAAFGGGTGGVHVSQWQTTVGAALIAYEDVPGAVTLRCHPFVDRSAATGALFRCGLNGAGFLCGEVNDGTTSRVVTATVGHTTGQFILPELTLSTSGTLTLKVNGVQVAQATGAPLLTLNNASAVCTLGNSRALDAPFPGSIVMARIGATMPTTEQSRFIYEQEKQMFREGAQVTLPDSGALLDMDYDPATDRWVVASAANESEFSGLVRVATRAVSAGSISKVAGHDGMRLVARTTSSPGVDVTLPALDLKEELLAHPREARPTQVFDFDAVAAQTDFALPAGWEAVEVIAAGTRKREGSTKDYTRLFDGFRETIRFAVAPGASTWVQIIARRAA